MSSKKEEFIIIFVDKVIFGFVLSLVIILFQSISDKNTRHQISKEAIVTIESQFIMNDVKLLQELFSEYVRLTSRPLILRLRLNSDDISNLINNRIRIESLLKLISIYDDNLRSKSTMFVEIISNYNNDIRDFEQSKVDEYRDNLELIKNEYVNLLSLIKISVVRRLNNNFD